MSFQTGILLILSFALLAQGSLWTDLAHQFQRENYVQIPVNEIPIPCAHNAYNSPKNLPPKLIEYQELILFQDDVILQNQDLGMTELLQMGIRHLQIDAHYIPKYNETWMCHGSNDSSLFCPLVEGATGLTCEEAINLEDLGAHTGCTNDSLTWEEGLIEIKAWVTANPNEFLWIEIEDQVSAEPDSVESQYVQPIITHFGAIAFTQQDLNTFRTSNPGLWPTIQQLRTMGKTVIFSGTTSKFVSSANYILDLDANIGYPANNANNFNGATCNSLQPDWTFFGESDIQVVVDILGININERGHVTVGELNLQTLQQVTSCGFSGCVDRVGNGDMEAVVWSWEKPYTKISCSSSSCAALVSDGWRHVDCSTQGYGACVSDTNRLIWTLTQSQGFGNTQSCPPGSTYSYPKTPLENKALKDAAIIGGAFQVFLNIPLDLNANHPICSFVDRPDSASSLSFSPFLFFFLLLSSLLVFIS